MIMPPTMIDIPPNATKEQAKCLWELNRKEYNLWATEVNSSWYFRLLRILNRKIKLLELMPSYDEVIKKEKK